MDGTTAQKAIRAIAGLEEQVWRMKAIGSHREASISVKVNGRDGYVKTLSANGDEATKIALAFWRKVTQRYINTYAREIRGCGVEVPPELAKYVTDYPIVPGAITNVEDRH